MKQIPLVLLRTAAILTACAVLTSQAWAQNGSSAQGGQSPRFETGVTVPADILRSKRPGVYLVSFNTPVGLPGVSLARGIYMFRFLDGRSAIQVLNATGTVSYGLFLPTMIQRSGAVNDASVWLVPPSADGGPRRVRALFEPGQSTGSEFIYR
jgi:hypothetical protein